MQTGSLNSASVVQSSMTGYSNTSCITQTGTGNEACVQQVGTPVPGGM